MNNNKITRSNEMKLYYSAKIIVILWCIVSIINHYYPILDKLKKYSMINNIAIGIIILCLLYVLFDRKTYLPFLEETILPNSLIKPVNNSLLTYDKTEFKKLSINIEAPEAKYIVWWAADPSNDINKVDKAYNKFLNSGVTEVVEGIAKIELYYPQKYYVKLGMKLLDNHLHYRESYNDGFMSAIKTVKL